MAAALGSEGTYAVTLLQGRKATSSAARPLLERADLFHFAGHGRFIDTATLESALPLATGGAMTVGDILALPRAPARVVIAGCETARASSEGRGFGLAQAFVLAGSNDVIASSRRTDDALAEVFASELYRAGYGRADVQPATAMQRAALATRLRVPAGDWSAFRVLRH